MLFSYFTKIKKTTVSYCTLVILLLSIVLTAFTSLSVPQVLADGNEEITGFAYEDINGNGSFDIATESGRAGVDATLFTESFVEVGNITTTETGVFTFNSENSSIAPNTGYWLFVFYPVTGSATTEGEFSTFIPALTTDQEYSVGNYGFFQQNLFSGGTFYDRNRDGIRQIDEEQLNSMEVTLQDSEGNILSGPASVGSGTYGIHSGVIPPGTYYLHFTKYSPAYVFTEQNAGEDDTIDSDIGSDARIEVTTTYGTDYENLDIGMYRANILISGKVFEDLNNNGIEDNGEPGVSNVQASVINRESLLSIASTTTDSDGTYQLSADPTSCIDNVSWTDTSTVSAECAVESIGGYYHLSFTTDFRCTMNGLEIELINAAGTQIFREDCTPSGTLEDSMSYSFLISTAETGTGSAFLNLINLDNPFDDAELLDTNLTYVNLFINFDNLPPDTTFTDSNVGDDDTIDSDVIEVTGDTANIFAKPGDVVENISAGLMSTAEEEEEEEEEEDPESGSGSTSGGGGGGSNSNRGSTRHVNWGNLGKNNHDSGNTWTNGETLPSNKAKANPLAPIVPKHNACLVSGRSAPKSFSDTTSNANLDFLTSITFIDEPERRLLNGYSDDTFGPDRYLTRLELLKIALSSNCASSGATSKFTTTNTFFSDIPQDNSETSLIVGEAYKLGIIKGVGEKFYPDQPVSHAEMIKILFHASAYWQDGKPVAELESNIEGLTDQSFSQAIEYAKRLEILPFSNETPFPQDEYITRSTMVEILANFIKAMSGTVMVNS